MAQYTVRWTAQSVLHISSPDRPVHSGTNSTPLGSIQSCSNYCAKTINSHFHSCQLYSFMQLSDLGHRGANERKCPRFETAAKVIRIQTLSFESATFSCSATGLHTASFISSTLSVVANTSPPLIHATNPCVSIQQQPAEISIAEFFLCFDLG